jgi:hypothetical protein
VTQLAPGLDSQQSSVGHVEARVSRRRNLGGYCLEDAMRVVVPFARMARDWAQHELLTKLLGWPPNFIQRTFMCASP